MGDGFWRMVLVGWGRVGHCVGCGYGRVSDVLRVVVRGVWL